MFRWYRLLLLLNLNIAILSVASAQVSKDDLMPLLSRSDQNNFKKAELNHNKGKTLEEEANKLKNTGTTDKENSKNEKKANLKRLEASQFFQKANFDQIALLKDNISRFWKNNKNIKIEAPIKNNEDRASELSRKAKSLRNVAEDLVYPDEKLVKILEAEEIEKESIEIFVKVLYVYLNQPIEYDKIKITDKPSLLQENTSSMLLDSITSAKDLKKMPEESNYSKRDSLMISESTEPNSITLNKTIPQIELTEHRLLPRIPEEKAAKLIEPEKNSFSIYEAVEINEDQVDKFNRFLENSYPNDYERYLIDFQKLDYSDIDSLRNTWHNYLFAQYSNTGETKDLNKSSSKENSMIASANSKSSSDIFLDKPKENLSKEDKNTNVNENGKNGLTHPSISKDTLLVASVNTKATSTNISSTERLSKGVEETDSNSQTKISSMEATVNEIITVASTKTTAKQEPIKEKDFNGSEDANSYETAKGFTYRVQILACRIAIDNKTIENIYNGNFKIIELREDRWFKYALGEFNTYNEAKKLRNSIHVPGAFVIAYFNGKRIKILNHEKPDDTSKNPYLTTDTTEVVYKIQIAASKIPLNEKYIRNIYSGSLKVKDCQEDGWYKYMIIIGSDIKKAKQFIESENIPGAFITSYLGDKKIDLSEAIRLK